MERIRYPALVVALFLLLMPRPALAHLYRLTTWYSGFRSEQKPDRATDDTYYYAPEGTHFKIVKELDDGYLIRVTWLPKQQPKQGVAESINHEVILGVAGETPERMVVEGSRYTIKKQILRADTYEFFSGFDFGALTLPFKYQVVDGTITAGASLGAFVGYRQRWLSVPTTILVSTGFAGIPTSDVNASKVETKFGLTTAAGIVGAVTDQFQIGVIVGVDHLGGSSGAAYPYEGHGWLSFSIGYAFIK